jgi:hypothetical protein
MSFLDNLENTLKSLEDKQENEADEQKRREREAVSRNSLLAAQPYADALRNGPFTQELLGVAVRLGHSRRLAVRPVWLGTTLRLEARDRRLDLEPTPDGVIAIAREGEVETWRETVDISSAGTAETLAGRWMS